jgi:HD superfamily phosphodiesterase
MLTIEDIKNNPAIKTYLLQAHEVVGRLGFTEHSLAHAGRVSHLAGEILEKLGCEARLCELARIAGYLHDVGNMICRVNHAQSGAALTFCILRELGMDAEEVAKISSAVGNHDESTGTAVSEISAALILADKSDVRRSRVRNTDLANHDVHDRVNYAVSDAALVVDAQTKTITLRVEIDASLCPVMDYFEIFLARMVMSRRAAGFLDCAFHLVMNGLKML